MEQPAELSSSPQPLAIGDAGAPVVGAESAAIAGWASLIGGILLGWPFLRGILGELQVPMFLVEPGMAPLAIASLALGPLAVAFGLVGWWGMIGRSVLGRTAIILLAVGLICWFVDQATLLAPWGMRFPQPFILYLFLVGAGSLVLAIDLRRLRGLPRDALLLIGLAGPVAVALLGAPWPLGLGAVVPATGLLYALGWIRLGLHVLRAMRRDSP